MHKHTHISRGGLSSDPLFTDQMTVTHGAGRDGGGKKHGSCKFSTAVCYYTVVTQVISQSLRLITANSSVPHQPPHRKPHTTSSHSHIPTALFPHHSHMHPPQPHPSPPSPSQSTLGSFQFASQLAPGFPSPVKRQAICCAPRLMPRRALNTHIKSLRLNRFSFANLYRTEVQSVSLEVYTP